jgi:hypothetical protein
LLHPRHLLILDITCDVYIGFDWIAEKIEFTRCPAGCHDKPAMPPINLHYMYLRGVSMDLTIADNAKKKAKTVNDLPEWIKDYADVFTLKPNNALPPFQGPGFGGSWPSQVELLPRVSGSQF